VARADILTRRADGWHLIEVKSSLDPKDELLDDLAYTSMVAEDAGVNLAAASLLLLSRDYRLGMADAALLVEHDCSADAFARAAQFRHSRPQIVAAVTAEDRPHPELTWACKGCEFFGGECLGADLAAPIFELPNLSETKFEQLRQGGASARSARYPLTSPSPPPSGRFARRCSRVSPS